LCAVIAPLEMLKPILSSRIEEKDNRLSLWIDRLDFDTLEAVTGWTTEPKVGASGFSVRGFGDDMLDFKADGHERRWCQAIATAILGVAFN